VEERGDPCRIGVLGGGQVFERLHLPALRRSADCCLVAVAEPSAPRREWLASAVPGAERLADPADLLARDDLDAILVLTPPATHADLAIAALHSGRPVLVEKPLAGSLADAHAVLEAAQNAGRPIQIGFNRRFRRTFRSLKRHVERDGATDFHYLFRADAGTWRAGRPTENAAADRAHLLQDVASHQLDLLPWLQGDRIVQVRARPLPTRNALELAIGVRFANGATADVRAAHGPGYAERLEARFPGGPIVAYPGALVNASRWPGPAEWLLGRAASAADLALARLGVRPSRTAESLDRQLAAFVARVRGSAPRAGSLDAESPTDDDAADGEAGRRAVAATAACEESLRHDGAWIPVKM
jgi:predicted dehydrogenase